MDGVGVCDDDMCTVDRGAGVLCGSEGVGRTALCRNRLVLRVRQERGEDGSATAE